MNPYTHAKISVQKRGGKIEDYYPIHFFMDSTKELCSDNRHRILHNLWGVRRIIIPIFGATITNSDGKEVNVKDLCEQDHILPDYGNKFIPTLEDFVQEFSALSKEETNWINDLHKTLDPQFLDVLISPLQITGQLKSLRITHNSWFLNEVVPKIFKAKPQLQEFNMRPSHLFNQMNFALWMDNGSHLPASAQKMKTLL